MSSPAPRFPYGTTVVHDDGWKGIIVDTPMCAPDGKVAVEDFDGDVTLIHEDDLSVSESM